MYRALVVLEDGEVLQDVVLDGADVRRAHPVLGRRPHEALRAVLVLDTADVPAQLAVDAAQHHQEVREVALHACDQRSHAGIIHGLTAAPNRHP